MERKLFGSQGIVALLVSAPSSDCPLARAQEHPQIPFWATCLLQCLLKSVQWLFGFSPLAFYEEIQRTLSHVLSVCLFWGLSHQMRWQSAAFPGVPC